MKAIVDLQLHSKYSRATSKQMEPQNIELWAWRKGLGVVGTGDASHNGWLAELEEKLEEASAGLYRVKAKHSLLSKQMRQNRPAPLFMITGEISNIYTHSHRVRKVHTLLWSPSIGVQKKINKELSRLGNIDYDGRPIIGITAHQLAQIYWQADPLCEVVPAHIWTPWFGLFGSKSGYDSVQQCYGEDSDNIHALETGLSSDPAMNWLIHANRRYTLVSNSDAHSLANIGREATILELQSLDYAHILSAIRTKKGFIGTIEFYPEEGMYHHDGHRACGVAMSPSKSQKLKNICPSCGKPLTLGVMHRVMQLADQPQDSSLQSHRVYYAVPMLELIAQLSHLKSKLSPKVLRLYEEITELQDEYTLSLFSSKEQLERQLYPQLADAIMRVREGKVHKIAGFDGQYGQILLEDDKSINQQELFR